MLRVIAAVLTLGLSVTAGGKKIAVLSFAAPWSGACSRTDWRTNQRLLERCTVLDTLADEARAGALAAMKGRSFLMMTRENTAQLIKEMGGDPSCSEGECEVETARVIGADFVISGNVALVERNWFVTLRLHESKNGSLLETARIRKQSQVALIEAIEPAVREMLGRAEFGAAIDEAPQAGSGIPPGDTTGPAPPGKGKEVVVAFESEPPGATVRVDGRALCSSLPCSERLPPGPHEAVFERQRYRSITRSFTAASGLVLKERLAQLYGWVTIESEPRGVLIAVNGAQAAKTPISAREVDTGTVKIAVADPCYELAPLLLTVGEGERRTEKLAPRTRMAGLKVTAEDQAGDRCEGVVQVDGKRAGKTGETLQIPLCSNEVVVEALGARWSHSFEGRDDSTLGKIGSWLSPPHRLEAGKVASLRAVLPVRSPRPTAKVERAPKPPPEPSSQAALPVARAEVSRSRCGPGMAALPAGSFNMRSRPVAVSAFCLDVTEVTAGAYAGCVESGKCSSAGLSCGATTFGDPARRNHPVNCVDWNQALAFCAASGKRLPTEEEWEWAARGAERGTTYPWGNDPVAARACWAGSGNDRRRRSFRETCPVDAYPAGASPQGVLDLAGNVWEWTATAPDPWNKVIRGGSWDSEDGNALGAAHVDRAGTGERYWLYGFRCATDP